jgi:hypothetical protein
MKHYSSIDYWDKGPFGEDCIAFNKIDGSSMVFEWSIKQGFYKFGTRNIMIDRNDRNFGEGIDIFINKYGDDLIRVFRDKYPRMVNISVFGEYFGENSFAGQHETSDKKDICIFDVSLYKRGIISPYEFVQNFGHLEIPKVIYEGKYDMDFINNIRSDVYGLGEGVVAKGVTKTRKGGDQLWSTKVKTDQWLKTVRQKFGDKGLLQELNGSQKLFELL